MGLTLSWNITRSIIHKADHTDAGGRIVPDRQSIAAAFADPNGLIDAAAVHIERGPARIGHIPDGIGYRAGIIGHGKRARNQQREGGTSPDQAG